MSRIGVWVVVEGRVMDLPFYDRLLGANDKVVYLAHDVRLVETLLVSRSGGGKAAAIALFDHYRRSGRLTQLNSMGPRHIVFMLDRDLDNVCGGSRRHPHMIYTVARDVEAEVHLAGDLAQALGTAASMTGGEAQAAARELRTHVRDLADTWRDWVNIGVLAAGLQSRSRLRTAGTSNVNRPVYGSADSEAVRTAVTDVVTHAAITIPVNRRALLESRVRGYYERGHQELLVKGKWLPAYIEHRLRQLMSGKRPVHYAGLSSLSACLLATIDFQDAWAQPYHRALDRALK